MFIPPLNGDEVIQKLFVRFLPSLIDPQELPGTCVVMTDVLRASTTVIQALAAGAIAVHPQADIEDARQLAIELGAETLLGGERGGLIIKGFDCGNSPREFTRDTVAGRRLVLCTSNGTYTLEFCRPAERVLIGAFVNLSAICGQLTQHRCCMIACAGTDRRVTGEDVLLAGAVADRMSQQIPDLILDDSALIARDYWRTVASQIAAGTRSLWEVFAKDSTGGRNLMNLNYQADVQFCAQIDLTPIAPQLDCGNWTIGLP